MPLSNKATNPRNFGSAHKTTGEKSKMTTSYVLVYATARFLASWQDLYVLENGIICQKVEIGATRGDAVPSLEFAWQRKTQEDLGSAIGEYLTPPEGCTCLCGDKSGGRHNLSSSCTINMTLHDLDQSQAESALKNPASAWFEMDHDENANEIGFQVTWLDQD